VLLSGTLRSNQKLQQLTDGLLPTDGFAQKSIDLDVVSVATARSLFVHIATKGQVVDNPENASLGDVECRSDVSEPYLGIECDAGKHSGMVRQEAPFGHSAMLVEVFT